MAAAAWAGLIFGTSCTVVMPHDFFAWIAAHILPDAESMRRFRVFWGLGWFAVVKGWHAAEFAILFLLAKATLDALRCQRSSRRIPIALAFCVLFAISDEYHQTFVPGRGGTWTDVAIDVSGATLAALTASFRQRRHTGEPG
nr:VanZ family protein [Paludisphaera mucosa]